MKKRTLMRRWHESHPLKSRKKWVRYAYLVLTTPLQLVICPVIAIYRGVIAFYFESLEEICDWAGMYIRAWSEASKLGEDNDD